MPKLPPLPSVKEIIRIYKLRAKKQLSQNFLLDLNITKKIVRHAGKLDGCHVCEVGPGPGSITRSIIEAGAANVYLIEKDERFLPGLQMISEACDNQVRVFHGDVLGFDMTTLFPTDTTVEWTSETPNIHIIGNLPFNVSTPLLTKWLQQISEKSGAWSFGRTKLTLTFQKEVGERMVARRNTEQRSRLSIMTQHLCKVGHAFTIPGKAFVPAPKVDVAVMTLVPLKRPIIDAPFKLVEKVVRHVFHYRQKYCVKGIKTLFPPTSQEYATMMINMADVNPEEKPYELSMQDFKRLCYAYKVICDENPGLLEYYYRSEENARDWREHPKVTPHLHQESLTS